MARDLFSRYVWIVDTISRYGRISRERLNELWMRSHLSDGRPIPERTFYHYRRAIEENFHIDILCDSNGDYYLNRPEGKRDQAFSNWLLDSYAVHNVMSAADAAKRVMVDDIPSAREFLPTALEAATTYHTIRFAYAGFNRSRTEHNILFRPYFLRLYKQRWYMIGLKEGDKPDSPSRGIRTYALDRVKEMTITKETFTLPNDITPDYFFGDIIGVSSSHAEVRQVRIKTTPTQAKYLRALPLHPSQSEHTHHDYSIFTYRLKLNYELVHELLSLGAEVEIIDPPELKAMLVDELRRLNRLYPAATRNVKEKI